MNNTYFIDEDYLKDNTSLTSNIDIALIYPFLKETQEKYFTPILGSKLYNKLIASITALELTSTPIPTNEYDLLVKIQPFLAYLVAFEAIPFIAIKIRNKGVLKASGDNLFNAELNEIYWLRTQIKNKAHYYSTLLQAYLCLNGNLFPEYTSPDSHSYPTFSDELSIDLFLGDSNVDRKFIKKYIL